MAIIIHGRAQHCIPFIYKAILTRYCGSQENYYFGKTTFSYYLPHGSNKLADIFFLMLTFGIPVSVCITCWATVE